MAIRDDLPEMLGIRETAARFGISQYYVRQLALSGAVCAVRVGRQKILVNVQSVADYFNGARLTAPESPNETGITRISVR